MPMGEPETITLSVPSRLEHLDLVQEIAERLAVSAGFDSEQCLDFGLAVREGAINAMKHGNGFDPSTLVTLRYEMSDASLDVHIRDFGAGFDPTSTPDPTAPENLLRTSGRGLLLIRSLVDGISFVRHSQGMELVLSRTRPQPANGSAAGGTP